MLGQYHIYYCTIIGHDDGSIIAEESSKINYAPSWETALSTPSPISSFAAHHANTASNYFWVASRGVLGSVYPILEYRKTYDGTRSICNPSSQCTVIFSNYNGGRIKAPMLYLPRGGGGGVTEDRVYLLVEYPNYSPQKTILYAFAYDSRNGGYIVARWSYTFDNILAGPAGPLALWRNNEARPIIVPLANANGNIYMLDERNGAYLTQTSIGTPIKASPSIDIYTWGFLYVPGSDGKIRKFDMSIAYLFNLYWTSADLTPTPKSQSIFSSIANQGDSIYVAIHNGYTDSNGKVKFGTVLN